MSDLDAESPIGWTHTVNNNYTQQIPGYHLDDNESSHVALPGTSTGSSSGSSSGSGSDGSPVPRLRDCLLLQPGSTVGDVYDALKKGAIPHIIVHGDFVRAEGKGLDLGYDEVGGMSGGGNKKVYKKRQLGRDVVIDDTCCVIRIQTNRKAMWQSSSTTATEAAAAASATLHR